jgi:hypothetical protein
LLRVASTVKDQAVEAMVQGGSAGLGRTRCREISALDVVPISPDKAAGGAVSADLFF